MRKMAQFMQLTPREKTDFMDAFYITQMGEEVYYRRKSVGELIETFSCREGKKEYIFHEGGGVAERFPFGAQCMCGMQFCSCFSVKL